MELARTALFACERAPFVKHGAISKKEKRTEPDISVLALARGFVSEKSSFVNLGNPLDAKGAGAAPASFEPLHKYVRQNPIFSIRIPAQELFQTRP